MHAQLPSPRAVTHHELSSSRGNCRVWLEGELITRANFKPGQEYVRVIDHDTHTITLTPVPASGQLPLGADVRKISSRRNKPIVDQNDAVLNDFFQQISRFRALAFDGHIVIVLNPLDIARVRREKSYLQHLSEGGLTLGSAFTGIGISTHATHQALNWLDIDAKLQWAIEKEQRYLDLAAKHSPALYQDATLISAYVEEVQPEDVSPVDLLHFSMACTNHSRVGVAKKGQECKTLGDEVTSLFGVVDLIKRTQPALMISENVREAKESAMYQILKKELRRLGYVYHELFLNGDDAGTLDVRSRYWMLIVSEGLAVDFSALPDCTFSRSFHKVSEILDPTIPEDSWISLDKFNKRQAANQAEGRNFKMVLVHPDDTKVNSIPRNYTKRQLSNPHPTDGKGNYRLFTRFEHAKMKRVPPTLITHMSETTAHEGLGQGVSYTQPLLCTLLLMSAWRDISTVVQHEPTFMMH